MQRLNLVDECHRLVDELSEVRAKFKAGKIDVDMAKQAIGMFNATSRAIGVSINAEKWYKSKQKHQ